MSASDDVGASLVLAHGHEVSCVVCIKDYSNVQENHQKGESVIIEFAKIAGVSFALEFYPNGDSEAEEGFTSLFLHADSLVAIMLSATFDVVDSEERCANKPIELEPEEFSDSIGGGMGCHFFEKSDIEEVLCGNTLRIRTTLKFVEKARLSMPFPPSLAFEQVSVSLSGRLVQLSDELNTMLSKGDGDVTICC